MLSEQVDTGCASGTTLETACERWRHALSGQFGETLEVLPAPGMPAALVVRWSRLPFGTYAFALGIRYLDPSQATLSAVVASLWHAMEVQCQGPEPLDLRTRPLTYEQVLALPRTVAEQTRFFREGGSDQPSAAPSPEQEKPFAYLWHGLAFERVDVPKALPVYLAEAPTPLEVHQPEGQVVRVVPRESFAVVSPEASTQGLEHLYAAIGRELMRRAESK